MKNTINSSTALDDIESVLINAQIDLATRYVNFNEKLQSEFVAKYGYENEDLLQEHDELVDELEALCKERRSM